MFRQNKKTAFDFSTSAKRGGNPFSPNKPSLLPKPLLIGLATTASLAVVASTAMMTVNSSSDHGAVDPKISPLFNEPCKVAPKTIHTIFVDSSDPISSYQQSQVDALLGRQFLIGVDVGDVVKIVRLTDDKFAPISTLYSGCNSGRGDDANILVSTPRRVEEKWKLEFYEPYLRGLKQAQIPEIMDWTPLIEGLEQFSHNSNFGGLLGEKRPKMRVLILSDLLQNVKSVSAYRGTFFKKSGQKYLKAHLSLFDNAEIIVGLIHRPRYQHLQGKHLWDEFEAYFKRSGATKVTRIDIF